MKQNNSLALMEVISDRLDNSPKYCLTFADYMNLVLYHPQYGYYSSGVVSIGSDGDFFTSVSLGKDFGELLAEQFVNMWQIMHKPRSFTLLEMGAGNGHLATDILVYLREYHRDFYQVIEYIIVEESPALIQRQQKLLLPEHNIVWKTWAEIAENSLIGCCFSNELIDAFPVHRLVLDSGKLQEIYVSKNERGLLEVIDELSTAELARYFQLIDLDLVNNNYPDGYRTEVNLAALHWLENLSQRLAFGYILTIDYGYNAERYYHPQRREGTLQCYYKHHHHDNPYINLGAQDITAHVDFTSLQIQGKKCQLETVGLTEQGLFLMALGLGNRLNELSTGKFTLPEIISRRDQLHQLISPTGLGKLKVLIQSKNIQSKQNILQGLQQL